MHTTRNTISLAGLVGNAAALLFWITVPVSAVLFFLALLTFDTPAAYGIGQVCALTTLAMLGSILTMAVCYRSVKDQEAR